MASVMEGEATPAQLGGLLLALRMRGETADELTGFAHGHARARPGRCRRRTARSTRAARAATGRRRSTSRPRRRSSWPRPGCPSPSTATGRCRSATGSADVLEALGIPIDLAPSRPPRLWRRRLRVPLRAELPPGDEHAGPVRRELGVPTAFNLLGPDDQSGRRAPPGDRGGRSDRRGQGRPCAAPPGHGARLRRPRRRRRRAAAGWQWRRLRRVDGRRAQATDRHRPRWGWQSRASSRAAWRRRGGERRDHRERARRRDAGRGAMSCCSTPARRCSSPAACPTLRHGVELAAATIDSGAARALLGARCARPRAPHDLRSRHERSSTRSPRDERPISPALPASQADARCRRREPRPICCRRWRGPVCTSSPRSSAARRRSAISARTTTSSRGRAPTSAAAPRRSPSCASRTGSTARSTICARSARAVRVPVLAKDFVVVAEQLATAARRRRGRSCCCSPCCIDAAAIAGAGR